MDNNTLSSKDSRSVTIDEKLDVMARLAAERGEPFNRKRTRAALAGKEVGPFVSADGRSYRTKGGRDKRNRQLYDQLAKAEAGLAEPPFEHNTEDYGKPVKVKSTSVYKGDGARDFEGIWFETKEERVRRCLEIEERIKTLMFEVASLKLEYDRLTDAPEGAR